MTIGKAMFENNHLIATRQQQSTLKSKQKKDPYGSFLFIHFNSKELVRIIKHLEIPSP